MSDRTPWTTRRAIMLGGIVVIVVACADAAEPETTDPVGVDSEIMDLGTISITSSECNLDATDEPIASGDLIMTARNETSTEAVADLLMIREGYSFEELVAHVDEELRRAEAGQAPLGHPPSSQATFVSRSGVLHAGESASMELDAAEPATYAVVCGRHHETAGELRPFAVLGPLEVVP